MAVNQYLYNRTILLKEDFRKEIFGELLLKYNWKKLCELLKITQGSIYRYKNKDVAVPEAIITKVRNMLKIPKERLEQNTIMIHAPFEARAKILDMGRTKRIQQLKEWKKKLPSVTTLLEKDRINVERWFERYASLVNFGFSKIECIVKRGTRLIIIHKCWAKGKKRRFKLILPRFIKLDENFQYFFGLWCGDKAGGGRLGILNKSLELIKFTKYFLGKMYQKSTIIVMKSSKISKVPKFELNIDKIQEVKGMAGTWVLSVYSVNGILKRFFDYLLVNLDKVLELLPKKNIFFAGLFDAEGNIFLEDGTVRWACKKLHEVEIYKKHLEKYNLFGRYDGSNIVSKNVNQFSSMVFPYIKHKSKINSYNLMLYGKGELDERFKNILRAVYQNNNERISDLSKLMGKKKLWAQIKFLEKHKYLKSRNYPKIMNITYKGLAELKGERT